MLVLCAMLAFSACRSNDDDDDEYVVTFDSNGGSEVKKQRVDEGDLVREPEEPTKEGYHFNGWYDGDKKWSFDDDEVEKKTTLTARWSPLHYVINFSGATCPPQDYTIEDTLELPVGYPEGYYEFCGWYLDEAKTKPITKIEKGTTGNLTLYADTKYIGILLAPSGEEYSVVGYDGKTPHIVIPSTYCGKKVTSIMAIFGGSSLKSVIIPNGIKEIRSLAFFECTSLESITIPGTVTTIGDSAFAGCFSLKSATVANGVTALGREMFCACTSLTSVSLPSTLTSIGDFAFSGCFALEEVKIPNGVTTIGNSAFTRTRISTIEIPDSVTSIGAHAFDDCNELCQLVIGSGVRSIGEEAFYNCYSLTRLTIPSNVVSIGDRAFKACTRLREVVIENGVASIGTEAFYNCDALKSITIPKSVTTMGGHVFEDCGSLMIYCEAEDLPNGWNPDWNPSYCYVEWGYEGQ